MSKLRTLLAILPALALGGCETLMFGGTPAPPDTSLRSFRTITMSCRDTPDTRKQVIQHNSAYDTLKLRKQVAYKDDCPNPKIVDQKAPTS